MPRCSQGGEWNHGCWRDSALYETENPSEALYIESAFCLLVRDVEMSSENGHCGGDFIGLMALSLDPERT